MVDPRSGGGNSYIKRTGKFVVPFRGQKAVLGPLPLGCGTSKGPQWELLWYLLGYWTEKKYSRPITCCVRMTTSCSLCWKWFQATLMKQELGTSYGIFQNFQRALPSFWYGSPRKGGGGRGSGPRSQKNWNTELAAHVSKLRSHSSHHDDLTTFRVLSTALICFWLKTSIL